MRLASKDVYPLNICKLVFGHVDNFGDVYNQVGYPEMVEEEIYMFMTDLRQNGDKNVERLWSWTMAYYRQCESIKDIAIRYHLSETSIRKGIEEFLMLLVKYWKMNPAIPKNIRNFNSHIIGRTGSTDLLDLLRSFGINSKQDLIERYKVDKDFKGLPGIKTQDRKKLAAWISDDYRWQQEIEKDEAKRNSGKGIPEEEE